MNNIAVLSAMVSIYHMKAVELRFLVFFLTAGSALSFLLVLYLSLPTFHFRGRKNEYSAQRGCRPLANRYHSRNHKIYREKSKSRNEAPDVEV